MSQTDSPGWKDGVPVSPRFDDPYFSLENGLEETRHVFLRGNGLPDRFRDGFHIAELGFGTGLNFLGTLALWRESAAKGRLYFTSFEAFPMPMADLRTALHAFPALDTRVLTGAEAFPAQINGPDFTLNVIFGDANETLPAWQGAADAWFLDGFSPAKNPELWSPALMQAVHDHTRPGGSFATYTAAGAVRRALSEAGFTVTRIPGYGRKRHMTMGERLA